MKYSLILTILIIFTYSNRSYANTDLKNSLIRQRVSKTFNKFSKHFIKDTSDHYIIFFHKKDKLFANEIISFAEKFYKKIAEYIGYRRFDNFWSWENRCIIVLFPNKESYINSIKGKILGNAFAIPEHRILVGFSKIENFFKTILPHELTHLILYDYFKGNPPLWINEGLATFMENNINLNKVNNSIFEAYKDNNFIPIQTLNTFNYHKEEDPFKIKLFYFESLSIVSYLINSYGPKLYKNFLNNLTDTKNINKALNKTYRKQYIFDLKSLEKKWIEFIKKV